MRQSPSVGCQELHCPSRPECDQEWLTAQQEPPTLRQNKSTGPTGIAVEVESSATNA
jgi:hypothetical protein